MLYPMTPSAGSRINDLLGLFGIAGGKTGAMIDAAMGNPLGVLANLHDAAMEAAMGRGTSGFERQLGQSLPAFGGYGSPLGMLPQMGPLSGAGYSQHQAIDLAPGAPSGFFGKLFSPQRRQAAAFERLMKENPIARMQFEQAIGGRITGFGDNDGKMTIERFIGGPPPAMALFANPLAASAAQLMHSMALGAGPLAGFGGGSPFMGFLAGGLGGLASTLLGGGPFGFGGLGGGFSPLGGLLSGIGGSLNPLARPGLINNNGRGEEAQHQAQVNSVLNDPSLTVEDRVMLMLMLICKKMDKDIQQQSEYVNRIQQQQSGGNSNGSGKLGGLLGPLGSIAGTAFGGPLGGMIGGSLGGMLGGGANAPGQEGAPSIDIETKKLERMVQKRSQMFDMLKGIMEKYDATSKGVIQSLGR